MTLTLLAALATTIVAGLMRGFAGVGSGMLMAPIFAVLYGPVETLVMIVFMEIIVTAQLLPSVRNEVEWRRTVLPMGLAAAVAMPAGTWLLLALDPETMTRGIAGLVLVSAVVLLLGWRYEGARTTPATLGVGGISGVLMAATSLGNPPVMLYLLSSRDGAAVNRANFTGYFAITLLALAGWMTARGLVPWHAVGRAALLLPVFMGAAWLGAKLFRRSSELLYRRVALGLLVLAGLYGLLR